MAEKKAEKAPAKNKRGVHYLTKQDKMLVLREFDQSGKVYDTCTKFGISATYFYKFKDALWDEYLHSNAKINSLSKFEKVTMESNKLRGTIEAKTSEVLLKCLNIMDQKLDNEQRRMDGNKSIKEKLLPKEITRFFQVAVPYILKLDENGTTNILQQYNKITNILNNQNIGHGNNEDTDQGDQQE